ncbi:hydrogenase iron-sulfur subunit [Candidatus Woesearchaeota archaeon]|nr:hydrogenase iron-sulfur subunit [Candidatus Woesearchaeota archaeon]
MTTKKQPKKRKTNREKPIKETKQEPRIGVFVCSCGKNIGGVVDVKTVTEYAKTLPNIKVAMLNIYTCADPGQNEIKNAIKEHNLNRVVVAACSPRMHEPTFRNCVSEAGLNPYLLEMANLREHDSWVHIWEKEKATEKAKEIINIAVAKARYLKPLENFVVPVKKAALVIGGGVAGCQAALDLASMGFPVTLVEKEPSIGGIMAALDKTFPTMDCSICILGPKLVEVGRHKNINLLTNSEIVKTEGYIGNFKVTIKTKPRYVIEEKCTGCGDCTEVCPVIVPSKFERGLKPLKAIRAPFPQAVPLKYNIDTDACIKCYKCAEACKDRRAIDFTQEETIHEIEVGTIIVATGCEPSDPREKPEYGYGRLAHVVSGIEFERIICAGGPTGGVLLRKDGKHAKTFGFIQCVGSRDKSIGKEYCSNVCCLNSIKNAMLIKEHDPDATVYIFYMDIRAFDKGFEELYNRARANGIIFIKGRPSHVYENSRKNPVIVTEDTLTGEVMEVEVDQAILAIGVRPSSTSKQIAEKLHIPVDGHGFFMESHPKLKPIDSPGDGIYIAGAAMEPKNIHQSVASASGAASRAAIPMSKGEVEIEGITIKVDENKCVGCGMCVKACPYGANKINPKTKKVEHNEAQCHGCGTCVAECPFGALDQKHFTDEQIMAQIDAALAVNPDKKILCFACNWCSYAGSDLAGVSRFQYPPEIRIIRVMCSGRVSEKFVLRAFEKGAQIVWVTGCHLPTDCHYISGNHFAKKRIEKLQKLLPKKAGLPPERLKLNWISAAEGSIFAEYVRKLVKELNEINAGKK